jgi:hypothetical protein
VCVEVLSYGTMDHAVGSSRVRTHPSLSLSLSLIYALSVSYALGRSLGPYAEDERLERRGQLLPLGGRGIGADQRLTSLTNDRIG